MGGGQEAGYSSGACVCVCACVCDNMWLPNMKVDISIHDAHRIEEVAKCGKRVAFVVWRAQLALDATIVRSPIIRVGAGLSPMPGAESATPHLPRASLSQVGVEA